MEVGLQTCRLAVNVAIRGVDAIRIPDPGIVLVVFEAATSITIA
jgi:hypothetical protein